KIDDIYICVLGGGEMLVSQEEFDKATEAVLKPTRVHEGVLAIMFESSHVLPLTDYAVERSGVLHGASRVSFSSSSLPLPPFLSFRHSLSLHHTLPDAHGDADADRGLVENRTRAGDVGRSAGACGGAAFGGDERGFEAVWDSSGGCFCAGSLRSSLCGFDSARAFVRAGAVYHFVYGCIVSAFCEEDDDESERCWMFQSDRVRSETRRGGRKGVSGEGGRRKGFRRSVGAVEEEAEEAEEEEEDLWPSLRALRAGGTGGSLAEAATARFGFEKYEGEDDVDVMGEADADGCDEAEEEEERNGIEREGRGVKVGSIPMVGPRSGKRCSEEDEGEDSGEESLGEGKGYSKRGDASKGVPGSVAEEEGIGGGMEIAEGGRRGGGARREWLLVCTYILEWDSGAEMMAVVGGHGGYLTGVILPIQHAHASSLCYRSRFPTPQLTRTVVPAASLASLSLSFFSGKAQKRRGETHLFLCAQICAYSLRASPLRHHHPIDPASRPAHPISSRPVPSPAELSNTRRPRTHPTRLALIPISLSLSSKLSAEPTLDAIQSDIRRPPPHAGRASQLGPDRRYDASVAPPPPNGCVRLLVRAFLRYLGVHVQASGVENIPNARGFESVASRREENLEPRAGANANANADARYRPEYISSLNLPRPVESFASGRGLGLGFDFESICEVGRSLLESSETRAGQVVRAWKLRACDGRVDKVPRALGEWNGGPGVTCVDDTPEGGGEVTRTDVGGWCAA
ncbi:hypothetical protein EW146_g10115, partial [Bondarzewia mesenterica]